MLSSVNDTSEDAEINHTDGVNGWYLWSLAHKGRTKYYLRKYQGRTVVHARSNASASGLIVPLRGRDVGDLDISFGHGRPYKILVLPIIRKGILMTHHCA
jgi:methyl coenzyme M reductase alpha subunit